MVKIIFSRVGKTKQPHYRIIAVDKQKDPWGKSIEILGNYNPRSKETKLETERIKYWISQGAQPSATVYNLFVSQGVIEGKKKSSTNISKKRQAKLEAKKPVAKEEKPVEAEPKTEAPAPAETEAK